MAVAIICAATVILLTLLWSTQLKAASIAQGYQSRDSQLVVGMAAALSTNRETDQYEIERAGLSNVFEFVGIVTTKDSNLLTITSDKANVVVATSGIVQAFVSDINGTVKRGDKVTISPLRGVLMKVESNNNEVFGTALDDWSAEGAMDQSTDIFTRPGTRAKVNTIKIEINSQSIVTAERDADISFLRAIGQNLTGKTLREWQVIVSLVIFILVLVAEAAVIYGAIHSSISALGRNPLAKDAVFKQLLQVVLIVLAVLAFGFATIYTIVQF